MCNENNVSKGEGMFRVSLEVHETDENGLCVFAYGGQLAHVGGVALAIPRPSLTGNGTSCDINQLCVPGHKDVEVAALVASRLASATNQPVSATVGIHIDDATDDEVKSVTRSLEEAVEAWIDDWQMKHPKNTIAPKGEDEQ